MKDNTEIFIKSKFLVLKLAGCHGYQQNKDKFSIHFLQKLSGECGSTLSLLYTILRVLTVKWAYRALFLILYKKVSKNHEY